MDVRDYSNLPNLWLNAAKTAQKNKGLNTNEKGELFKETKLVINEIKSGDPLIAFELSCKIARTLQNFKPKQRQSICNLIATMGERGAKKLNKLFEVVLSSHPNQETTKAITLVQNTAPINPEALSSWVKELQIDMQNQLQIHSIKSNPETALPSDVLSHIKSNYLDVNSIYQLNITTKGLIDSKFPSKISRNEMVRKDLIMLINNGKISLKSLGIHTVQELIDYLKEDTKLVTRLTLCAEKGLVESFQKETDLIYLDNQVTDVMLGKVLEHFPNLRELNITDPLSEDLAQLLSQNKLGNELKKIPNLEKLSLNCANLTSIDFLSLFPKLTQIEFDDCQSLGLIDAPKYFSRITHLELSDCTEITGLENLPQLKELSLRWIEGMKFLDVSNLKNLMCLSLYYCPKLIQIEGLKNVVNLRELRIFKERPYSLQNPDIKPLNFAPLTNLRVLILDSYSATLKGFSKLKSLTQLQLRGCTKLLNYSFLEELTNLNILQLDRLNDEYARQIAQLKHLSHLDLKGSAITTIDFLKNLNDLVYVNFSGCKKIHSLESLRSHPSLKYLNLDLCSNIRDITPLNYLPLKELMLMGIPFITVSKENKKVFKTISTLTHLDLSDQTAVDAECLAHHPALTEVYLRKNKILNQEELLEIPDLKRLTTQETECSEEIIAKLEKNHVIVHKNYSYSKNPLLF